MSANHPKRTGLFRICALFLTALVLSIIIINRSRSKSAAQATNDAAAQVEQLVATEEWIVTMGSALGELGATIDGLPLIAAERPQFFSSTFQSITGIPTSLPEITQPIHIRSYRFAPAESMEASPQIWPGLGDQIASLEGGSFGILGGDYLDPDRRRFRATTSFSARGQTPDQSAIAFESKQEIDWVLAEHATPPSGERDYVINPDDWRISAWRTIEAKLTSAPRTLFEEITSQAIPDAGDRALIAESEHSRLLDSMFSKGKVLLKKDHGQYFMTDATAQHPALSVVDIDGDGRDDLYVCVRWGRNLLFRDQGDGTFKEVAADYGLDIEGLTSAALFADFDNDGDQDVFLGRTLERSAYLTNVDGKFIDQSISKVSTPLPYLTTSLSAADYNGDGLLDIYFSTYGFGEKFPREAVAQDFLGDYPPRIVAANYVSPPDYEPFLNLPGPPNVLLVNQGDGDFALSPLTEQLAVWRETLQSTWADFDGDGDMDLYVCNDFAPDGLFQNEGGQRFIEVTATLGDDRMLGFGMGASFGDFDNDLDLDLYVSNMYSKAGLRITDRQVTRDRRIRWSAEGNRLFRNNPGQRFELLEEADGKPPVIAKADWSWGGQFFDINNDRFLDLYVPNGYFTAPEQFAAKADL